jgi:hypothetical protein
MSEQQAGQRIPDDDQGAVELRSAVQAGDIEAIQRLLRNDPALATARFTGRGGGTSTPLYLFTDSPGYFPNGPAVVRLLVTRGAAEHLLSRGADLNWEPDYAHGTPLDAASVLNTRQENVISWLRRPGARSSGSGGQDPS